MLENHGQFEQFNRLRCGEQVNCQEKYRYNLFHVAKLRKKRNLIT